MKNSRLIDTRIGVLLSLVVFCVYLSTLSSTVGTEDPGELAAVLHTLGIAHPSGYPLFTLLGYAFAKLPLGGSPIWRMNLFGAVLTALATFIFFHTFLFLFSDRARALFRFPKHTLLIGDMRRIRIVAAFTTVILAFSARYWFEAVSLEVYALHLVFLALVTWMFLRASAFQNEVAEQDDKRAQSKRNRAWTLFAFTLGLSFAHHMMTVLLAPAFLGLYFTVHGVGRSAWIRILKMVPPFLAPLILYLYLPLRAVSHPVMNWGDPSTLEALWQHVSAAQYRQFMFTSWDLAMTKLVRFTASVPQDFGYAPVLAAVIGMGVLWRDSKRLLAFSFVIFATGLFYVANYAFDDPNFYLTSHFIIALWAGYGLLAMLRWARNQPPFMRAAVWVGCALVALFPLALNYTRLDKSHDSLVEDYARNVLNSMDPGSVFFTNEYERMAGPAYYLQLVEGFRTDIAVLDIDLFGNAWYYAQLQARFPWLIANSRETVEAYRAELERFNRDPVDTLTYEAALGAMAIDMIEKSRAAGRHVYVSERINPQIVSGYARLASGMVFLLAKPTDQISIQPRLFAYKPFPPLESNPLTDVIRTEYARGYANQGGLRVSMGDKAGGAFLLRKALEVNPDFPAASNLLRQLETAP